MKKIILALFVSLFFLQYGTAQKLKGNKVVTLENRDVGAFHSILVKGKVAVFVTPNAEGIVSVETDENLHDAVKTEVVDGVLEVYVAQKITRKKLLEISIGITDSIQQIELRDRASVVGMAEIQANSLSLVVSDNAAVEMTLNTENLSVLGHDRAKLNLIVTNEAQLDIVLDGHSYTEMQISSEKTNARITEDASLRISGNCTDLIVTAKDNVDFKGQGLLVAYASVKATDKSNTTVNVSKELSISSENKAKIYVYDNPTFFLDKFIDKSTLYKKQ